MTTFLPYFVPFLPVFWVLLKLFSLFLNYFLSSYILDFQFVILAYTRYSFPNNYNLICKLEFNNYICIVNKAQQHCHTLDTLTTSVVRLTIKVCVRQVVHVTAFLV